MGITNVRSNVSNLATAVPSEAICVGVCHDTPSGAACEWAAEEAGSRHVPLAVLNAWDWDPRMPWPDGVYSSTEEELEMSSASLVQHFASGAAGRTASDVYAVTAKGSAVDVLIAASRAARLLVVGSRQLGAFERMTVGSVANAVMVHSACPVVVMPQRLSVEKDERAVVGVAGDESDDAPLRFAFDHAQRHGRRLSVLYCWQPPLRRVAPGEAPIAASDWLDLYVAPWRKRYPGVEVQANVLVGHAVDCLVDSSLGTELLVVGSRPPHARMLNIGSVSLGAVHHAKCPVAVIPPGWPVSADHAASAESHAAASAR